MISGAGWQDEKTRSTLKIRNIEFIIQHCPALVPGKPSFQFALYCHALEFETIIGAVDLARAKKIAIICLRKHILKIEEEMKRCF